MAKSLLVANWKNFPSSLEEAKRLIRDLRKRKENFRKVSLFVAPPYPYFEIAKGFGELAAQDLSLVSKGYHTGEVTVEILKSFGVRLVISGHSERRALGELPGLINQKVKLALKNGLVPLICIGEKEKDKDGLHFDYLRQDLKTILSQISKNEAAKIAIAYEPQWAIGKSAKDSIDTLDLQQTVMYIKKVLSDFYGRKVAEKIPILYGGAVEPENAQVLFKNTGIRGFLVGHKSLNAKDFSEIAKAL